MIFTTLFYDGSRDNKRAFGSTGFYSQIVRFDLAGIFAFMSDGLSSLSALMGWHHMCLGQCPHHSPANACWWLILFFCRRRILEER